MVRPQVSQRVPGALTLFRDSKPESAHGSSQFLTRPEDVAFGAIGPPRLVPISWLTGQVKRKVFFSNLSIPLTPV